MPLEVHRGLTFHVQELGDGPPLVMLHGLLLGSMATWYFGAAQRLAQRHRVLLFDLRGHGRSERPPARYDVATMVADLEALTARFGATPLTLVGHSFGAVVALRFALAHPQRVARLVLVEAPSPPSRVDELDGFLGRSPEAMAEALPSSMKDALARGGRQATRFVEGLRALLGETSLLADIRAEEDPSGDALGGLDVPVLCVYGASSSCKPAGERLARALPRARFVALPGGHFLPAEAPHAVAEVVDLFLAEAHHG